MNDPASIPTSIPEWLFPLFFVLMWCAGLWLISQLSGWNRLAQRYRASQSAVGKRWAWQDGRIGWAGYNGVLILTANAEGLFMEVFWLFGISHPRLFIPWRDFHQVERKDSLWRHQVRANIGLPPLATMRLPAVVFGESEGRQLSTDRIA